LHHHLISFYEYLAGNQFVPNAAFEKGKELNRCLSGIPRPYENIVMGIPSKDWDEVIQEQLHFFNKAKVPFVWYLDESADLQFKEKLQKQGFQDVGLLRGVIGSLHPSFFNPQLPSDCTVELVKEERSLAEFHAILCQVFGMEGVVKEMYKKVLSSGALREDPFLFHWILRKQGKAVSIVSTLIKEGLVSFWNGATLPEWRRHGFSSLVRQIALQHAMERGCRFGMSYLLAEGLAYGICKRLGYQTKWRFHAFLSPQSLE
jgi:hypothetical protein